MDSNTIKSLQEAYSQVHQLDEISQKTATSAYASIKTGEFEGADSERDVKRTDNLKKHIVRKFGKEAGEHADKAAEAQTFGRKDASGRSKQSPKPRIEKSDYRTTQDGKMHKQDQRELKTELRIKRDRRLRKEDVETDLFDYLLEYLVAEGYADTNKAAISIMANMSEEWRQDIVEKYVDYRKGKLASGKTPKEKLTNKLERTKIAASREQRDGGSSGPTATPSWKRAKKAGEVKDEMDDNTSAAGKVRKVIHLGRRDNAGPSVQRGEPNTERHQRGIDTREKSEK